MVVPQFRHGRLLAGEQFAGGFGGVEGGSGFCRQFIYDLSISGGIPKLSLREKVDNQDAVSADSLRRLSRGGGALCRKRALVTF